MEGFLILLILGVWLGIAFWTSKIASSKGHSGGLWFFLGAVLGVLALLIIAVMGKRD